MKRPFLITIITIIAVTGIVACKKNNVGVDVDPVQAPAMAEFAYYNQNFAKSFYVQTSNTTFKIPVGITNVSNKDRTVQFTYSSPTAVAGTHYTAPSSIVIPAGKALDSVTVTGIPANIATGAAYVLKIKITGGDVPALAGKDSVMLTIRKYCPVVLSALQGLYNNTNEYTSSGAFSYGPYTTAVNNLVSTGATTATGKLVNLYDDGWNDITANFDWTDPANFKISIPLQPTGKSYSGAPTSVRTSTNAAAVSTFSSCDRSLSFGVDLVNGSTVISGNYKFVMK